MIGFHYNRSIPTTLKLNGPSLEYLQQPVDASETLVGFATFVGIVSATYPPAQGDIVEGSFEFHWFLGETEIFDSSIDINSNVDIESSGNITTCTFSNVPYGDSGKTVSVSADYIPADGEGNANNDNLRSNLATLSAFPEIIINTQPTDVIVGSGLQSSFNIDAEIFPDNGETLFYQWQVNGRDLVNGSQTLSETTESEAAKLFVTSDAGDNFEIDFLQVATFSNFLTNRTYTITTNADITVKAFANGGGGGGSGFRNVYGTAGGKAQGNLTFFQGETYYLRVGAAGGDGSNYGNGSLIVPGGFPGGGDAPSNGSVFNRNGGGGGYTGVFVSSVVQSNSILIAGGGGGSTGDPARGGNGGGTSGTSGSNGGRAGKGGTQTAGGSSGSAGSSGESGSALKGGRGAGSRFGAGGGGAGYFGGGGGTDAGPGAAGGGSGFLHPTLVTEGSFSGGSNYESNGSFRIDRVSIVKQIVVEASGVNSPNLTLDTDDSNFGGVVRCVMSASNVQNSPLESKPVSYEVVDPRSLVTIEAYTFDNQYKTQTIDLDQTNTFTIDSSIFGTDYSTIQFYCPEKEVTLTLDLYGAKGIDNGSFAGGNGGSSKIQITPTRDVEYTLIGVSNNSGLFLYRGSSLIACVGSGGDAGTSGNGGDGGGINIPGDDGSGRLGGFGGEKIDAGTLALTGDYGSVYESAGIELYPGDSVAQSPNGGVTISCTKGSYWINQGIAACSNNSDSKIKFVNVDGTTIDSSSSIIRGFKPGYTISNTSGIGLNDGGRGGNGATGGGGGTSGSGGGGGSGYTNGEANILSSSLGGGFGNSRFVISGDSGGFYVDSFGRILILSSTSDTNPNNLPQTTGVVNIGDNAVIDDARWRNFLDLARDGTQNYRLTATLNNRNSGVTSAAPFNIYRMLNTNGYNLANSLNGFKLFPYPYDLWYLAWDETSGSPEGFGSDYSILSWSPPYGYGYYGLSSNSFFSATTYGVRSANWWILPPGVPDF